MTRIPFSALVACYRNASWMGGNGRRVEFGADGRWRPLLQRPLGVDLCEPYHATNEQPRPLMRDGPFKSGRLG